MNSGNIWLKRSCLLFQLKYKNTLDTELLYGYIEKLNLQMNFLFKMQSAGY